MFLPVLLLLAGPGPGARRWAGPRRLASFPAAAMPGPERHRWCSSACPSWGWGSARSSRRCWSTAATTSRPLSVTGLLHKVKVSNVRPVPARLRGTIIGKGVPGLIWSEDFVMRDGTGILFLDYRQPLRIWEWLFGLFRAGDFAGKAVEVVGWFRRAPVALPRAQVDHGRRRHSQQLRPPRPLCLGGLAGLGGCRADRRGACGWLIFAFSDGPTACDFVFKVGLLI